MQLNRVLKFFCRSYQWNTASSPLATGAVETSAPLFPFVPARYAGTTPDKASRQNNLRILAFFFYWWQRCSLITESVRKCTSRSLSWWPEFLRPNCSHYFPAMPNGSFLQRSPHIPLRAWRWPKDRSVFLLIVLFTVPTGCAHAAQRARTNEINLPTVNVRLGEKTVKLWVAATTRTRDHGLMYIKKMPNNRGMLFVFHHQAPQTFWMKHTLIPLDIIFLNRRGVIVRHYTMEPDNGKKLYPSGHPIAFAIELNAGAFKQLKLHNTMRIRIPKLAAHSAPLPGENS